MNMPIKHSISQEHATSPAPGPAEYLQRVNLALRYMADARTDLATTLSFSLHALFDVIDAHTASVWNCRQDGSWECAAKIADGPALPVGYATWESVNMRAIHANGVLDVPLQPWKQQRMHHLATATRWAGDGLQVMHVVATVPDDHTTSAHRFLEVIASLILTRRSCARGEMGTLRERHPMAVLTQRQRTILTLMGSAKSYRLIADELGYSESTVKQEAARIFEHFGVSDRAAAVRAASNLQSTRGH